MKPGTYLFVVHDTNDSTSEKVIRRHREGCTTQDDINRMVDWLLEYTEGTTEWSWVEIF